MIRAVRGATTTDRDDADAIREAMAELLEQLVGLNGIQEADVLSLFLTLTPDLHAVSPARLTREILQWRSVPMMSAVEPVIDGLPERCIRLLIQFETERPRDRLRMVYLRRAQGLRPDLA